jgi:hypothetical protein
LCTKCGSKELLEVNCSNDEHSSFPFQIVHMDLEGRMSHVPKELLFFMRKVSSPLHLSINGAKITSSNLFSNLVKHFHSPNWQVHNWDVQKKINNFFRIVIKFHMIKLMDSLVYIENKNKIGHRCEVKAFNYTK